MADHYAGLSTTSDNKKYERRAALYKGMPNKKPFTFDKACRIELDKTSGYFLYFRSPSFAYLFSHRELNVWDDDSVFLSTLRLFP